MHINRPIEYRLSRTLFNSILDTRKGDEKKENPYKYAMKVINSNFNLYGHVTSLFIVD